MYSVLLVDDELLICKGLSALIDWSAYGFYIADYALNAIDALEKTSRGKYDVIITDIRMPEIDGLELIRRLKEQKYDAKVVILSGYRDFEFARSVLKHGVNNYLIKPVDEEDLIATLGEIRDELEEESRNRTLFSESLAIIRERIISDLCRSGVRKHIASRKVEEIGIKLTGCVYCVCMVDLSNCINYEIESGSEDYPAIYNNVKNIIENSTIKSNRGFAFEVEGSIIGILVCKNKNYDFDIKSFCQELYENIKTYMDCISMSVGNVIEKYSDLPQTFENARKLLEWKFFNQSGGISYYEELRLLNYSDSFTFSGDLERLVEFVRDGEKDLIVKE